MKSLKFKNNDKIPIIGLGTWKSGRREIYRAVREAVKTGYRHFDCAAIYGNEKEIGDALKDSIRAGEITREDIWITSKLWNNAHQKDHVSPQSLCILQADPHCVHTDLDPRRVRIGKGV